MPGTVPAAARMGAEGGRSVSTVHTPDPIATMTDIPVDTLLALPLDEIVARLPAFLGSYVTEDHGARAAVVGAIEGVRTDRERPDWAALHAHMGTLGSDFGAWPRNDLATAVADAYMTPLIGDGSSIEGLEHLDAALEAATGRRLLIVGNHLSYADTMALTSLLNTAGRRDVRERITAVAGPKVYSEPMRRLAAASIHSIKVAQSASVASDGAQMSPRDVVRIAKRCLAEASEMMDCGHIVLIYPEGTRSRTGRLGSFLKATNRWLTLPGVVVLPTAVWGTESLYTIDDDLMHPADCHARFCPPIDVDALRQAGAGRDDVLAAAWDALDALLPDGWKAAPGTPKIA